MYKNILRLIALVCALATSNSHASEENGIEYSGTGFMTIGAGKMLGGTRGNVTGLDCPCFIADYAQAGYYDGRRSLQWGPDSKLGAQGSIMFDNRRITLTTQAVSRGASNGSADLEWLYVGYKLNDKITLNAGRQRLPMFYYSAAQDIGFSLPWTHLPGHVYGWPVVNYNGASMRYHDQFGDWSANTHLFGGNEHNSDSKFWKVMGNGPQSVTRVDWTNILGASLALSKDWFEARLVHMQNNTRDQPVSNIWNSTTQAYDIPPALVPVAKQKMYGLALRAEYESWMLYSEFIHFKHPGLTYEEFDQYIAVGHRYGKWLPMVRWEHSRAYVVTDGVLQGAPATTPWNLTNYTASLGYDLTTSSKLKLQYDYLINNSYWGSSRLLTFTYDRVF